MDTKIIYITYFDFLFLFELKKRERVPAPKIKKPTTIPNTVLTWLSPVFGNVLEDMVLVELFVAIVFDGVGVSLPPDVLTFV